MTQTNPTSQSRTGPRAALTDKSNHTGLSSFNILAFVSVLSTVWLVWSSVTLETIYLANYGFFYDPAAYYASHIGLYQEYLTTGAWSTILHELAVNDRAPWRTVPYLLFAPKLLSTTTSHLWTEVPLLFSFIALLAASVYARTKSLLVALAACTIFSGIPFLYDPAYGIAAFWLDLTAALAMGCAALCLLRFSESRHSGWMYGVGLFATLTATSRWSAACYLILFFSIALIACYVDKRISLKAIAASLGCALLTGLPGLFFTLYFFKSASAYYATAGYAFNAPISQSIQWTATTLQVILGVPILATLLLLTGSHIAGLIKTRTPEQIRTVVIACWLPTSIFIFLCFISKAVNGVHPLAYFAPALVISAFYPIGNISTSKRRVVWRVCACSLIVYGIASGAFAYQQFRRIAKSPALLFSTQKQTDVALSKFIVATRAKSFLQLDTQTIMPQLEAFYSDGVYSRQALYFSNHEFHLRGLYPNRTPQQVATSAYDDIKKNVALVAVFSDPKRALAPGIFPYSNPYTVAVSHHVSKRVALDPDWKLLGRVNGVRGLLSVYQNNCLASPRQ